MYTLYTDKQELFEAQIDIQGKALEESSCRLLVESDKWNLLFSGEVESNGNVKIPVKKLKSLFNEGDTGTLKLEVIADDVYFTPWQSDFKVDTSKKVTVEVKQQTKKKSLIEDKVTARASIKEQRIDKKSSKKENLIHIKNLSKSFMNENISVNNIHKNKDKVSKIINNFLSKNKLKNSSDIDYIVENVIKVLTKL